MVLKVYKVKISCGKHNVSNIKKGGTIIFAIIRTFVILIGGHKEIRYVFLLTTLILTYYTKV